MPHLQTQSFWEEYSSTSISRITDDEISHSTNSELASELPFGNLDRESASKNKDTENIGNSDNGSSTEITVPSSAESTPSGKVSEIDVENIGSISNSEDFQNIGKRIRKPKQFPGFIMCGTEGRSSNLACLAVPTNSKTPVTINETLNSPEAEFWIKAIMEELESFEQNNVWSLEFAPANSKIVGNRWVYKRKLDTNGAVIYRARLVAKGYTQTQGVDYFETLDPVVRRTTLRLLFATAVNYDLKIYHLDVKTAFLHGDLYETVYMAQPEGFTSNSEEMVCKLDKAMYGLKQAARSWNLKLIKVLKDLDFKNFADEPCVYIRNSKTSIVIVALYVDDFYVLYNSESDKKTLFETLNHHFKIKDLGEAKNCLGMKIIRDWSTNTLILQQEDYINSVLSRFNMKDCNGVRTPMECKLKLSNCKVG